MHEQVGKETMKDKDGCVCGSCGEDIALPIDLSAKL